MKISTSSAKFSAGCEQQRPRAQRAIDLVNAYLGDAVGQIYAQKYFSPEAKAEAQAMVANLIAAYHKRLAALPWLAPSTRAEAQAKLDTLYVGIGYPETWLDYSAYEVRSDDAFGNSWRYGLWNLHHEIARIGKPVDRHEWCMTPQTVNAVEPAAAKRAQFSRRHFAAALLRSRSAGSRQLRRHRLHHRPRDQPYLRRRKAATSTLKAACATGGLPPIATHFDEAAVNLEKQYDAYEIFPGVHVNGKQTINENIADLGGIAAAYDALPCLIATAPSSQCRMASQATSSSIIAFGQNWGSKAREAALRNQVLTDPHAPAQFRADIVRNSDAWYKAFNVKPGDKLYLAPDERVKIW